MKKKFFTIMMIAASTTLTGCEDEEVVAGQGGDNPAPAATPAPETPEAQPEEIIEETTHRTWDLTSSESVKIKSVYKKATAKKTVKTTLKRDVNQDIFSDYFFGISGFDSFAERAETSLEEEMNSLNMVLHTSEGDVNYPEFSFTLNKKKRGAKIKFPKSKLNTAGCKMIVGSSMALNINKKNTKIKLTQKTTVSFKTKKSSPKACKKFIKSQKRIIRRGEEPAHEILALLHEAGVLKADVKLKSISVSHLITAIQAN